MDLRLDLIKSNCLIGNVTIPLNSYKVSADNTYKPLKKNTKWPQYLKMSVLVDA
jgi:hypothetical protein